MAKVMEFNKEIMYMFDVPNNIIMYNGTQFTVRDFRDFFVDLGIKINYASVSHPQSNGQVECSNGMILRGLKPRNFDRLKPYAGKWVKELPSESCHGQHTIFFSLRVWGNVAHWSGAQAFMCSSSTKSNRMPPGSMI
jgi:transposase InsO family protein